MSWQATGWAKATRGHKGQTKLVLLVLSDYYDDERGVAWPSQQRLADDCEMPERTVRRALADLERMGFITKRRKGNQYQPSEYELNFEVSAQLREPATDGMSTSEPVADAQLHEPARSEPANMATAEVNRPYDASEPATSEPPSRQEPPSLTPSGEEDLNLETGEDEEGDKSVREGGGSATTKPDLVVRSRWLDVMEQDPRWPAPRNPNGTVEQIEEAFKGVDLYVEALRCYEWLQGPKGLKRIDLKRTWLNWLSKAKKDLEDQRHGSSQSGQHPAGRGGPTDDRPVRESWDPREH